MAHNTDVSTNDASTVPDNLVYAHVVGTTGRLELNRPRALNSLNLEMVEIILDYLEQWRDDPSVTHILITSTSERAFCAGGDVRAIREQGMQGQYDEGDRFFNVEYKMNEMLAVYPKPIVSLIHGVVMGGGLGVSAHGSHRVVTEKTFAAMPEMLIGFIPDVGMSWRMQKMVGGKGYASVALANFLATTGMHLKPADMLWSGLATHYIDSSKMDEFVEAVIDESKGVDAAIEAHTTTVAESSELARWEKQIEQCFAASSWSEIRANLEACEDAEFVDLVREHTKLANPTSLVATIEVIAATVECSHIGQSLGHELTMGNQLRREPNFAEGVRAVLIDKDRNPSFVPNDIAEVDEQFYRDLLR
ncbi:3-hydroxyisobutyryl-CoA hydrolase [Corynebacterium argentoratense]|uniref:3-hydroxyisobutyryl-CoA hydrolase n=1 Tax=Corynebacterium argentoratense TaxID=42817 RepID=UPI001F16EB3C|nr:3-hydroxyisobutyryl-CoA hydrolase [Corynebacterium argentoratense]MCF1711900.1 3-hydroxyisobutyryl-CoA hydrolase [Corynebacterium argentoratense]